MKTHLAKKVRAIVSPIQTTDDAARQMGLELMQTARHAALGVMIAPDQPLVTRVAFGLDVDGVPISLISGLAAHTRALSDRPQCSLLIGEPGARGDALSHPRLSLIARAKFCRRDDPDHENRAAHYLLQNPKAKLYLGLGDFNFVRFIITRAALNGGFGKAYQLEPADLNQPS